MEILQALDGGEMDRLRAAFNKDPQGSLGCDAFVMLLKDLVERKCAEGQMRADTNWRSKSDLSALFDEINHHQQTRVAWEEFSSHLISATAASVDTRGDDISPYFRLSMQWTERHQDRVRHAHYVAEWDKVITSNTRGGTANNAVHSPSDGMKEIGLLPMSSSVLAVTFIAKHHALVCSSGDMMLTAFDTIHPSWPRRRSFGCDRSILRLEHHREFGTLWMGDRDGCVSEMPDDSFRNLPGGAETVRLGDYCTRRWSWHTAAVTGIQFIQRTSAEVITSGMDGRILVHDVVKGTRRVQIDAHLAHGVRDISWCGSFGVLVSVGALDRHPHAWVLNYPRTPFRLVDDLAPHKSPLVAVHAVRSQPQVLTCDRGGVVKVWDLRQFRAVQTLSPERSERQVGADRFYTCAMCYIPTMRQLTIHGHRSFAWECDARTRAHASHDHQVLGVVYGSQTRCFITFSSTTVKVWSAATGCVKTSFEVDCQGKATAAAFGPAGRRVFVGTSKREVVALLLSSGDCIRRYPLQAGEVTTLLYTDPVKRLLISGDSGGVLRFISDRHDVSCGAVLREIRVGGEITSARWLPHLGLCAFGASGGEARCGDPAAQREPIVHSTAVGGCEINAVASLHPFPCVALADSTGHLYLWAVRPYRTHSGVCAPVLCIRRLANPDYHSRKTELRARAAAAAAAANMDSSDSAAVPPVHTRRPVANCLCWDMTSNRLYAGDDGGWMVSYDITAVVMACRLTVADSTARDANSLPNDVPIPMHGRHLEPSVKWRAHTDEIGQADFIEHLRCIVTQGTSDPTILIWTCDGVALADLSQGRRDDVGHPLNSRLLPYKLQVPTQDAPVEELQAKAVWLPTLSIPWGVAAAMVVVCSAVIPPPTPPSQPKPKQPARRPAPSVVGRSQPERAVVPRPPVQGPDEKKKEDSKRAPGQLTSPSSSFRERSKEPGQLSPTGPCVKAPSFSLRHGSGQPAATTPIQGAVSTFRTMAQAVETSSLQRMASSGSLEIAVPQASPTLTPQASFKLVCLLPNSPPVDTPPLGCVSSPTGPADFPAATPRHGETVAVGGLGISISAPGAPVAPPPVASEAQSRAVPKREKESEQPPRKEEPAKTASVPVPQQWLLDFFTVGGDESQSSSHTAAAPQATGARSPRGVGRRSVTKALPHGLVTYLPRGPLGQALPQQRPASPPSRPAVRALPQEPEGQRWRGGLLPDVAPPKAARLAEQDDVLSKIGGFSEMRCAQHIPKQEASVRGAALEQKEMLSEIAAEAAAKRKARRRAKAPASQASSPQTARTLSPKGRAASPKASPSTPAHSEPETPPQGYVWGAFASTTRTPATLQKPRPPPRSSMVTCAQACLGQRPETHREHSVHHTKRVIKRVSSAGRTIRSRSLALLSARRCYHDAKRTLMDVGRVDFPPFPVALVPRPPRVSEAGRNASTHSLAAPVFSMTLDGADSRGGGGGGDKSRNLSVFAAAALPEGHAVETRGSRVPSVFAAKSLDTGAPSRSRVDSYRSPSRSRLDSFRSPSHSHSSPSLRGDEDSAPVTPRAAARRRRRRRKLKHLTATKAAAAAASEAQEKKRELEREKAGAVQRVVDADRRKRAAAPTADRNADAARRAAAGRPAARIKLGPEPLPTGVRSPVTVTRRVGDTGVSAKGRRGAMAKPTQKHVMVVGARHTGLPIMRSPTPESQPDEPEPPPPATPSTPRTLDFGLD